MTANFISAKVSLLTAIGLALVLGFAAGCVYTAAKTTSGELLFADYSVTSPTEYFPHRYQNQAGEAEPLPPQF